jgi:hypothetical protein
MKAFLSSLSLSFLVEILQEHSMIGTGASTSAPVQGGSVFSSGASMGFKGFSWGPPPTPAPVTATAFSNPPAPAAASAPGSSPTVFGGSQPADLDQQTSAKQVLSNADLEHLVGNEVAPVWSNEKGESYLMPWEAALLSMLFAGRPSSCINRHDVALTVALGQSLLTSHNMTQYRHYVAFGKSQVNNLLLGSIASPPWRCEGKPSGMAPPDQHMLAAARNPSAADASWRARLGILPPKNELDGGAVIEGALSSDHFEIFRLAVEYRNRRTAHPRYNSYDLHNIAKTTNPD